MSQPIATGSRRLRASLLIVPLLLTGCGAAGDPMVRQGTWHASADNDANLVVMLTDPNDLTEGRGAVGSLGSEAEPAITRLLTGARLPLPSAQTASSSSESGGQPPAAAPNGSAAGGSNGQSQ